MDQAGKKVMSVLIGTKPMPETERQVDFFR
jgi:hypothetical protein